MTNYDKPFRYECAAPLDLNFLWISYSIIEGKNTGEILFWFLAAHLDSDNSITIIILPTITDQ